MADTRISGEAVITPDGTEYVPLIQVGSPVTAGSFVSGTAYVILSIGSTDFTAIGATNNTVGLGFVATGAGSGTGTAGATSNKRTLASGLQGKGLFSQVRSATPTIASTGLSTWLNQASAVVTDGATGLIVSGALSATNISGRTKAVPTPPYSIDVLIDWETSTNAPGGAYGPMFGWTDNTKIQAFVHFVNGVSVEQVYVLNYATVTSGSGAAGVAANVVGVPRRQWLRISDDNAGNVSFSVLPGGNHGSPVLLYTVAKASGYLGATGYSNVFFGINRNAGQCSAVLHSYTER